MLQQLKHRCQHRHFLTGSYLLTRAAVATNASEQSIYYLNETKDEFDSTESQEERKESYIPLYYVLGFLALGPRGAIHKVPADTKSSF